MTTQCGNRKVDGSECWSRDAAECWRERNEELDRQMACQIVGRFDEQQKALIKRDNLK